MFWGPPIVDFIMSAPCLRQVVKCVSFGYQEHKVNVNIWDTELAFWLGILKPHIICLYGKAAGSSQHLQQSSTTWEMKQKEEIPVSLGECVKVPDIICSGVF